MTEQVELIDVHCHLADRSFDSDRKDVIARARDAGVSAAIVVGECYEDNLRVLELAAAEPFVKPALGHHPWKMNCASQDVERTLRLLEDNRSSVVAIGEVGLDYRLAETEPARAEQRAVFRDFIAAAHRLHLPLSVHVRSAGHYVLDLLRQADCPAAALHAFDGKAKYVRAGAADGFYFSVPGTVLVSPQKRKLVRALPVQRLLFESDAPALSPQPDGRSEPALIAQVAATVAELKQQPLAEIAKAALANTRQLFAC